MNTKYYYTCDSMRARVSFLQQSKVYTNNTWVTLLYDEYRQITTNNWWVKTEHRGISRIEQMSCGEVAR